MTKGLLYLFCVLLNLKITSLFSLLITKLSHLTVVDHRDCVGSPGLDHPVHQLPLSGEGVELQDVIRVGGGTVITALIFIINIC